ncbi:MAG: GAF domain-containing protein [Lachnospiraceae bacterium]|nr:GAF domain-containing protein [Lachnospiraceae bacterium]
MSYIEVEYPEDKKEFYKLLAEQIRLYTGDEKDFYAVLANASSVMAQAYSEVNWVGFYLIDQSMKSEHIDRQQLVVGPFQGRPAVSRITYGTGVCGTAWKENSAQVVDEVSCFAGHIACDCNTHSEIVIPMYNKNGEIIGVLDMDSVVPARFDEEDKEGLTEIVKLLVRD